MAKSKLFPELLLDKNWWKIGPKETWLKDINNKMICKGDILARGHMTKEPMVVYWEGGLCCFRLATRQHGDRILEEQFYDITEICDGSHFWEVIGNIEEDTKFLKTGELNNDMSEEKQAILKEMGSDGGIQTEKEFNEYMKSGNYRVNQDEGLIYSIIDVIGGWLEYQFLESSDGTGFGVISYYSNEIKKTILLTQGANFDGMTLNESIEYIKNWDKEAKLTEKRIGVSKSRIKGGQRSN